MHVAAAHQLSALRANGVLPMHRLTPAVMTTPTATHSAMHILNTSTYCNQAAALHNSGAAWLTVAAHGDWGGRVVRRWQCVSIGLEQVAAVRQLASLHINGCKVLSSGATAADSCMKNAVHLIAG